MANTISTAFINGFTNNIYMLSQQKLARLAPYARQEMQKSEKDFFERIGTVDMVDVTDRHGDTPILDTPHSRRMVTLTDSEWGDLIDDFDKVRLLISPESAYAQAAVMAANRRKDLHHYAAALGNAYTGKAGTTPVALPSTQKVACFDGTTTSGVNLNVDTLRKVRAKFWANEIDENIPLHIAVTSSQLYSMLGQEKATSQDYAAVKALVNGEIDTFMGFKFHQTELIPRSTTDITYTVTDGTTGAGTGTITAAKSRRCYAWAEDGILMSKGTETKVRIAERADKRFGWQVYVCQSYGAVRMEEEKVVEIDCAEV